MSLKFVTLKKSCNFASRNRDGLLTEWLGTGLQNRLLRFESGRDLKRNSLYCEVRVDFCFMV